MREFLPGAPLDAAAHWRLTRRLSLQLLAGWFVITVVIIWFARELDRLVLFGWPLSFYMAAQGATLIYVAMVGAYAWRMRSLDLRYEPEQDDA
ncbi:MAG: putative solute:sodium symporter small subunit [Bradyrhizobium sp.]|jgi:putative solute:sodium symporter small subunit